MIYSYYFKRIGLINIFEDLNPINFSHQHKVTLMMTLCEGVLENNQCTLMQFNVIENKSAIFKQLDIVSTLTVIIGLK